ncbi:MAG: gliding motility-associated-like protein [Bacteroidia bacterium]|jgi:gliding motility-associated-like protein
MQIIHKLRPCFKCVLTLLCAISFSHVTQGQLFKQNLDSSLSFHQVDLQSHNVHADQITDFLLQRFHLSKTHAFVLRKTLDLSNSESHKRYDHYYEGNRILGSDVVCHFSNGLLTGINGRLRVPTLQSKEVIAQEIALERAKVASKATAFKWEFPEEEAMYKIWQEDSNATYYPTGELIYAPKDLDFKNPLQLCYSFEINAETPLMRKNIFIDAFTGQFVGEEDLLHQTDVKGSANTKYRGVKPITTDSTAPGKYRLREVGRGGGIETYDMNKGTRYGSAVDFTDTDNYWNNYNTNFDEIGGDAHFGAEKTYDFFKLYFNRNSFDGKGAKIRSYVHYRSNYVNAFWNGSVMTYGDGNGTSYTPLTSVDICGHEIAHAVTSNSARLIYRYESGALNESFSDIFGNAIEYFADSTQFSWRMGEDIMASASGLRNMANPKTHRDPSTYKGTYWYGGTGDNGGVHTNSGVQNFWFYVLTTGASGTNDKGDKYKVDSLGIHKAQQIAYRNLTVYLTSSSDYADARHFAIQSATDLYGDCSKEVQATTNAWYAVGVGNAYDSAVVVAQFEADTTYCNASEVVQFVNRSSNAKTYVWDFGDGKSSTKSSPTHVYPSQGKYSVQLIAESCFKSNFDTIKKTDYILIDSNQDICSGYLLPKGTWSTVHACHGFIYDHNGEADYQGLLRDTLTIDFGISDSAQITFEEFEYENKYDSIYVYDGSSTNGILLGGFTGKNLPFAGKTKTLYSGAITIRHFSDPLEVGTGFKVKFETFKEPLRLFKPGNRNVCHNESVTLTALGRGGDIADHAYFWNGIKGRKSITFTATTDTLIYITFGDDCMKEYIYDSVRISVKPPIQFTQSNDTLICEGSNTQLNVKPTGGKGNYTFRVFDGNTQVGSEITYATPNLAPGIHNYWIQFSDGCTTPDDTAFFQITVRDSLSITASLDTTICYGTNASLTAFATGGLNTAYSYDWGNGKKSNPNHIVGPLKDNTYTVTLSDGCSDYEPSADVTVQVLDSLSLSIQGVDTACYGERIELTSTVSGGMISGYTYLWKPSLETNSNHFTTIRATSDFTLEFSDGCTPKPTQATHNIVARAPLSLALSADTTICIGETATVHADISGGIKTQHVLTWNNGLGTGIDKQVSPTQTTTYHAHFWDGCSDSISKDFVVTVNALPTIDFNASGIPNCTGIEIQFTEQSNAIAPSSYLWNFGDGNVSGDQNPIHSYNTSGQYTIHLIVQNEFRCTDSLSKLDYILIEDHPVALFSCNPLDPSFLNARVNFVNASSHQTKNSWNFGDGKTSEDLSTYHIYPDSGSYTATLLVENSIGCTDEMSKTIFVKDDVVLYIPNAISPNNDVINDKFSPFVRGMRHYDIMIFNRWGEVLWKSTPTENQWDGYANGSRVPMGFYFYRITGVDMNGNDIEENGKFNVVY